MALEALPATGLVGLGTLGSIFAGHLAAAADEVVVFDLDPGRRRAAAAPGVRVAASCAEVAAACEVVVLSLPHPDAVRAAVTGDEGLLAGRGRGLLVIDSSTIDPQTARAVAETCAEAGAAYVDAPLSGGEPMQGGDDGARAASVTFMVGGTVEAYEQALPVLHRLGIHAFHLGPAGAGSEVKLVSNMCSGLYALVTAEAFAVGAALGYAPEQLLEVFQHTDAKSFFMTDYLLPRLLADRLDPGFAVRLQLKDHRLFASLADAAGVPAPLNEVAVGTYEAAVEAGDAEREVTMVVRRAIDAAIAARRPAT
jgi:3-hydroxyisobutyrate dehydrogenase-like beta-hydroxyacid dehydrogenase